MDICIPHNGWGRKSQNVILWENSHYLFFINTVILIETQLPAEKAAHFWNILSLLLKSKQQTFEWKSGCFHFFFPSEQIYWFAMPWGKLWVLWLKCSQGFFWASVINLWWYWRTSPEHSVPRLSVFSYGHHVTNLFLLYSDTDLKGLWSYKHPHQEPVLGNPVPCGRNTDMPK